MMKIGGHGFQWVRKIGMFFPLVLLVHHLKHNLVALFYWLFFFAIISDTLGKGFGLSYLFLSPVYQGETSFWSFALIGFSFGGLSMAFHSYSYAKLGPRFPFLAMVNKPFIKFCINNSGIPLIFLVIYLGRMIQFQLQEEYASSSTIFVYCVGLLIGFALFVGIAVLYFFPINKNVFELKRVKDIPSTRMARWSRFNSGRNLKFNENQQHQLYYYIGRRLKVQQCRSTKHYNPQLLQSVFAQNRISTTIFEFTTISAFVILGLIGGKSIFDVPAAMSIVLLLTILLMIFSSVLAWLKVWTYPVLLVLVLFADYCSVQFGWFHFQSQAYGLNYETKVPYTIDRLAQLSADSIQVEADLKNYIQTLNNWKKQTGKEKPVLIVVNTSGGGSRSAAWVYEVLRTCDSVTGNTHSKHIAMITGASGGMVGASFYRSLKLKEIADQSINVNDPIWYKAITEDLLNKLSFAASTNDIFFCYRTDENGRSDYSYDRGMAFEDDLNENTQGVLNQDLNYFARYERSGRIPLMIFSPTIVNDGRRAIFSGLPMSFLQTNIRALSGLKPAFENVDMHQLLGSKQVGNLRLTSVLRMNATFPFVLPMSSLPTIPEIQLMDAGSRDNFGAKISVQWLNALRKWISEETAGVVVLQIRDTKKVYSDEKANELSFLDKFSQPVTQVFSNFPRTQDLDQDELWASFAGNAPFKMQVVTFNLRTDVKDRISLSWHLTENEKIKIKKSIQRKTNRLALDQLKQLLL